MTQSLQAAVAGARDALSGQSNLVGEDSGQAPRFELFNAPTSICSQKVRAVLAHHRSPYVSHNLNLFEGQSYLPGYVRLRMLGCARFGGPLASHHSGDTSASAGGCDGAVVPTLVDWRDGEVVVDSKRICLHLDAQTAEAERLRPGALAAAIDEELAVVDRLPNYQMLMGRKPSASEDATSKDSVGANFSRRKVAWCDRYLQDYADDAVLTAAYRAKRAKELSAAEALFSADAMSSAYGRVEAALSGLEDRLGRGAGPWLFGAAPTLADLFWGIELLRLRTVGAAVFRPRVTRLLAAAEALPALRAAILEWPGATF